MSTLYDAFILVFGEYSPIIVNDPVSGVPVEAVNWGYIFSCLMAVVCLYCVLRIIGGLLTNNR